MNVMLRGLLSHFQRRCEMKVVIKTDGKCKLDKIVPLTVEMNEGLKEVMK